MEPCVYSSIIEGMKRIIFSARFYTLAPNTKDMFTEEEISFIADIFEACNSHLEPGWAEEYLEDLLEAPNEDLD